MKRFHLPILLLASICVSSCAHYYKAVNAPVKTNYQTAGTLRRLEQENRTMILRNGTQAFLMLDAMVSNDQHAVTCILHELPDAHRLHLTNGRQGKMKYVRPGGELDYMGDTAVLNEAHIYINPDTSLQLGVQTLMFKNIQRIEIIEKDNKRSANSKIFGVLITLVSAAAVAVSLMAASLNLDFSSTR